MFFGYEYNLQISISLSCRIFFVRNSDLIFDIPSTSVCRFTMERIYAYVCTVCRCRLQGLSTDIA